MKPIDNLIKHLEFLQPPTMKKDKAYITGNDPKLIQEMMQRDGLWLCVEKGHPWEMVPIWSSGGKLFAMIPAQELKPDGFHPGVQFFGPFRPEDVIGEWP
jgi:hypothetical protein